MRRRASFSQPATVDVQGVLGTFKVPRANIKVEYVLTYASLDGGTSANGQLLNLLAPVREVFHLGDLDFDHLLQRDLDDFRVSEEMVPYLLGETSSDPRFFPPIVAVIVPMSGGSMEELYPQCSETSEEDQGVPLKVFRYGSVFSVKREERSDGKLAQSPVDLCIHDTRAKLVIVDGQYRAMAMLAAYRSASNKWNGNEFQHFYKKVDLNISELNQIHLPVCIAYFPELTQEAPTTAVRDLTTACRKFFLDVNRNARHPSEARQILLDDTDLVACFTRHLFNMVKNKTNAGPLRLHHTEYDNPHNRVPIFRPFAITDVYTLFSVIRSVLLMNDNRVRNPLASPSSGRFPQNNPRLRRELDLANVLTEDDIVQLGIAEITNIRQDNYPRRAEEKLRSCFDETWGRVIVNALSKLYPFATHIKAVDTVLEEHKPYTGVNKIAHTALVEGQGLRHTLDQQQQRDKKQGGEESDAQKAWKSLQRIEEDFAKCRARLYLKLSQDPEDVEVKMVNRLFDCFRSSAFQTGLFMAFAYLKDILDIDGEGAAFVKFADKWITRINRKFQKPEGVRDILFDHSNPKSLRWLYKPTGGLTPSDWVFFRYLVLELLSVKTGPESARINQAKIKWREKLYTTLYNRKQKALRDEDEDEDANSLVHLDLVSFREIVDAFNSSLAVDEEELKVDLSDIRKRTHQSGSEVEDEDETDETDDSATRQ